jgi:Uri superfamily endonuclease
LTIGKLPELLVSLTPGIYFWEAETPGNRRISSKWNTRSTPVWHVDFFTQQAYPSVVGEKEKLVVVKN